MFIAIVNHTVASVGARKRGHPLERTPPGVFTTPIEDRLNTNAQFCEQFLDSEAYYAIVGSKRVIGKNDLYSSSSLDSGKSFSYIIYYSTSN